MSEYKIQDIHAVDISSMALRHAVYRELLLLLAPASIDQTLEFIANLALCRKSIERSKTIDERDRAIGKIVTRFRDLRVSPNIATATNHRKLAQSEIEESLERKFGDALADVPGFYRTERWRLNLPESCCFHAYRSSLGFINGFLCQPLNYADRYFLLSSAKYDGFKAIRLTAEDQQFFEGFKEPIRYRGQRPDSAADLSNFRWTGRRFVEKSH